MAQKRMSERLLYQMPFCPFSRKIAFGLCEKGVPATPVMERTWKPSSLLMKLNPSGELPVFQDGGLICGNDYIACEYIEEVYSTPAMLGQDISDRLEARRIMSWFDRIFYHDVYMTLFYERALKRAIQHAGPDTHILKTGRGQLRKHMAYVNFLTDRYAYIAGNLFSWADITAAAHLSCLDYLGEIPWPHFPFAQEWYMKIKSRPAFRIFLTQMLAGIDPAPWYSVLDF
jgi:glutathione S-transferase